MKINRIIKESRTFMPEIMAPGTGLSPATNKSVIPTNNVHTIQDVMDGVSYKIPGGGGNWSEGEDVSHSYKDEGGDYKREVRDFEIINKMLAPREDQSEKWKVKLPGGSKIFPSFDLAQRYRERMRNKGIPIKWVSRIAAKPDKVQVISSSLKRTFKVESIDTYNSIKETGAAFCVAPYHFVTCAHVIVKYDKSLDSEFDVEDYHDRLNVFIIQNGHKIPAKVVAMNSAWDIAILKADVDVDPFSMDVSSMQVGDDILTIGSPHGFENNASFGNIGSVGRQIYGHQGAPKYFFIDAPVFQGNSGGPIVKTENGEVIGMLTSIVAQNGEYGLNVGLPSYYIRNFCIMHDITTN